MTESASTITVAAPARLHMGFIDMHGGLKRRFGGLGLTLDGIETRLCMTRSQRWNANGPASQRAMQCAQQLLREYAIDDAISVTIDEAIPEHIGLGSGTQLSLAVAAGLSGLFPGQMDDLHALAQRMQRGIRSGIGLGAFESGGFIVDGGRGEQTVVPPVIARLPFPSDWHVLLVFDPALQGLNGSPERDAFHQVAPMASGRAAELCRIVMMQVLPAIAEADFDEFSGAITIIQNAVGDYFADYQGGRYTSVRVGEALHWLQARGVRGVGQSSWGPTGFAFVADADRARGLVEGLKAAMGSTLEFSICAARNRGAQITRGSRERLAVRA